MIDRQKSQEILDSLLTTWVQSRSSFRDSRVHCGRLIREYIVQRLREVDDIPAHRRGISRQGAIEEVCSRLGIRRHVVNELIRISAVVDLFWGKDEPLPDAVTYSMLFGFQFLICRPKGKLRRNRREEPGTINLSQREQWSIDPDYEDDARRIWKIMINQNLGRGKVIGLIKEIKPTKERGLYRKSQAMQQLQKMPADLFYVARNSSPRDLADMIMTLVEHSPSPDLVLKLISQRKINL